jgi:hypothetical protein
MPDWRAGALLLLLAGCASGGSGAPARPQPARPAPKPNIDPGRLVPEPDLVVAYPRAGGGLNRYALTRRDSVVITMPTGETQTQLSARTAFVTLTWIATDSATQLTATVDSLQPDSGFGLTLAQDSARGLRLTGQRDRFGRVSSLEATVRSTAGDQLRDEITLLFPPLPEGGARAGAVWSDTTVGEARVTAFESTETAVVEATAGAVVALPGTGAAGLEIEAVRHRSAQGEITQFDQPMQLESTGLDSLNYLVAPDGRVFSAEGRRRTDVLVTLPAIGQSVPARELTAFRMMLLP